MLSPKGVPLHSTVDGSQQGIITLVVKKNKIKYACRFMSDERKKIKWKFHEFFWYLICTMFGGQFKSMLEEKINEAT